MSAEFIHTVGAVAGLRDLFTGPFMKGRGEARIAMVGRSNVGKSSLINALVESSVAQVSNEPGKTRCIHFYLWKEARRIIADLPGYGYARTAKEERERWSTFINAYFKEETNLEGALILLDSRHGPTDLDEEAIKFLAGQRVRLQFIMTKTDQLKTQAERSKRKKEVTIAIEKLGFNPSGIYWVSAKSKDGLKTLATGLTSG